MLLLVAHHAVPDFRPLMVFDELLCAAASGADPLPAAGTGHPGFVRWQRELLSGPEGERLRATRLKRVRFRYGSHRAPHRCFRAPVTRLPRLLGYMSHRHFTW